MTAPFETFARSLRPLPPLRAAITAAYRRPEPECVPPLLDLATLSPAAASRSRTLARRLIEALRAKHPRGGVEGLVQEYALSSQEGVALMCLAEALLRIPGHDHPRRADPRQDRRRATGAPTSAAARRCSSTPPPGASSSPASSPRPSTSAACRPR
jgi:hypothetical protein